MKSIYLFATLILASISGCTSQPQGNSTASVSARDLKPMRPEPAQTPVLPAEVPQMSAMTPAKPISEFPRLTVDELHYANKDNAISAKALYHNKVIEVRGVMRETTSEQELHLYLGGDSLRKEVNQIGCTFPQSAVSQIIAIHKVQSITVRGRLEITETQHLWLYDCTIVN